MVLVIYHYEYFPCYLNFLKQEMIFFLNELKNISVFFDAFDLFTLVLCCLGKECQLKL